MVNSDGWMVKMEGEMCDERIEEYLGHAALL